MKTRMPHIAPTVALVLLSGLLTACGITHHWIYDKRGMTPESLDRDRAVCRAASPPRGLVAFFGIDDVDRDTFTRCMQERGYTARRERL